MVTCGPPGIFGECYEPVRRHCMGMGTTITECRLLPVLCMDVISF